MKTKFVFVNVFTGCTFTVNGRVNDDTWEGDNAFKRMSRLKSWRLMTSADLEARWPA